MSKILLLVCSLVALASCATDPGSVQRQQEFYRNATNSIATAQQVSAALPSPLRDILAGAAAIASAALAGWNAVQGRRIRRLENGDVPITHAGP
jgi:hypothetical protein